MTEKDTWTATVEAAIERIGAGEPGAARFGILWLAKLLRSGHLPEIGRTFLADELEAIADRREPAMVKGMRPIRQRASDANRYMAILQYIERESIRLQLKRGDTIAKDRLRLRAARKYGVSAATPKTVETRVSEARKRRDKVLKEYADAIFDRYEVGDADPLILPLREAAISLIRTRQPEFRELDPMAVGPVLLAEAARLLKHRMPGLTPTKLRAIIDTPLAVIENSRTQGA